MSASKRVPTFGPPRIPPRPDTPHWRHRKTTQNVAIINSPIVESPIAQHFARKIVKRGARFAERTAIGRKLVNTCGAALKTLPIPKLASELRAIKKNPPHLSTQLFMGQYTASFKLTPTRYAAIEEGILAAHRHSATPTRDSPKALPAPPKDSPLVISEDGVFFPYTALQKSPIADTSCATSSPQDNNNNDRSTRRRSAERIQFDDLPMSTRRKSQPRQPDSEQKKLVTPDAIQKLIDDKKSRDRAASAARKKSGNGLQRSIERRGNNFYDDGEDADQVAERFGTSLHVSGSDVELANEVDRRRVRAESKRGRESPCPSYEAAMRQSCETSMNQQRPTIVPPRNLSQKRGRSPVRRRSGQQRSSPDLQRRREKDWRSTPKYPQETVVQPPREPGIEHPQKPVKLGKAQMPFLLNWNREQPHDSIHAYMPASVEPLNSIRGPGATSSPIGFRAMGRGHFRNPLEDTTALEGPSWLLNRHQLRGIFAIAYDTRNGLRPSLADGYFGAFLQKLAMICEAAGADVGEAVEEHIALINNHHVYTTLDMYWTFPGQFRGEELQWKALGSFYADFAIDAFGHYYIHKLYLWVKYDDKWQIVDINSRRQLGHPANVLRYLNVVKAKTFYPWPTPATTSFSHYKSQLLLCAGFVPLTVTPPYAEASRQFISDSFFQFVGLSCAIMQPPCDAQIGALNDNLELRIWRSIPSAMRVDLLGPFGGGEGTRTATRIIAERFNAIQNKMDMVFRDRAEAEAPPEHHRHQAQLPNDNGDDEAAIAAALGYLRSALPPVFTRIDDFIPTEEALKMILFASCTTAPTEDVYFLSLFGVQRQLSSALITQHASQIFPNVIDSALENARETRSRLRRDLTQVAADEHSDLHEFNSHEEFCAVYPDHSHCAVPTTTTNNPPPTISAPTTASTTQEPTSTLSEALLGINSTISLNSNATATSGGYSSSTPVPRIVFHPSGMENSTGKKKSRAHERFLSPFRTKASTAPNGGDHKYQETPIDDPDECVECEKQSPPPPPPQQDKSDLKSEPPSSDAARKLPPEPMVYYSSSEDESRFQQVSLDDNVKIENVTLEDFGEPLPPVHKLLRCSSSSSDDEETAPELEKPKIPSQKKTQLATIVENSDSETEYTLYNMILNIEQISPKKKNIVRAVQKFFKRRFVTYQYPISEINDRASVNVNPASSPSSLTAASVSSVLHCPPPPYPKIVGLAALMTKEEPADLYSQFSDETIKKSKKDNIACREAAGPVNDEPAHAQDSPGFVKLKAQMNRQLKTSYKLSKLTNAPTPSRVVLDSGEQHRRRLADRCGTASPMGTYFRKKAQLRKALQPPPPPLPEMPADNQVQPPEKMGVALTTFAPAVRQSDKKYMEQPVANDQEDGAARDGFFGHKTPQGFAQCFESRPRFMSTKLLEFSDDDEDEDKQSDNYFGRGQALSAKILVKVESASPPPPPPPPGGKTEPKEEPKMEPKEEPEDEFIPKKEKVETKSEPQEAGGESVLFIDECGNRHHAVVGTRLLSSCTPEPSDEELVDVVSVSETITTNSSSGFGSETSSSLFSSSTTTTGSTLTDVTESSEEQPKPKKKRARRTTPADFKPRRSARILSKKDGTCGVDEKTHAEQGSGKQLSNSILSARSTFAHHHHHQLDQARIYSRNEFVVHANPANNHRRVVKKPDDNDDQKCGSQSQVYEESSTRGGNNSLHSSLLCRQGEKVGDVALSDDERRRQVPANLLSLCGQGTCCDTAASSSDTANDPVKSNNTVNANDTVNDTVNAASKKRHQRVCFSSRIKSTTRHRIDRNLRARIRLLGTGEYTIPPLAKSGSILRGKRPASASSSSSSDSSLDIFSGIDLPEHVLDIGDIPDPVGLVDALHYPSDQELCRCSYLNSPTSIYGSRQRQRSTMSHTDTASVFPGLDSLFKQSSKRVPLVDAPQLDERLVTGRFDFNTNTDDYAFESAIKETIFTACKNKQGFFTSCAMQFTDIGAADTDWRKKLVQDTTPDDWNKIRNRIAADPGAGSPILLPFEDSPFFTISDQQTLESTQYAALFKQNQTPAETIDAWRNMQSEKSIDLAPDQLLGNTPPEVVNLCDDDDYEEVTSALQEQTVTTSSQNACIPQAQTPDSLSASTAELSSDQVVPQQSSLQATVKKEHTPICSKPNSPTLHSPLTTTLAATTLMQSYPSQAPTPIPTRPPQCSTPAPIPAPIDANLNGMTPWPRQLSEDGQWSNCPYTNYWNQFQPPLAFPAAPHPPPPPAPYQPPQRFPPTFFPSQQYPAHYDYYRQARPMPTSPVQQQQQQPPPTSTRYSASLTTSLEFLNQETYFVVSKDKIRIRAQPCLHCFPNRTLNPAIVLQYHNDPPPETPTATKRNTDTLLDNDAPKLKK
ncbi:Oidioi.mRNA.OKI2018_I69.chr2.g7969.t1.cds [Oikopleura dioica]|uniref:Oidioi.mRNA.OKI2018_I69.chr2.g7969.t1.cds n=1 Tax=Oikopleura dioica TaxID=34765 RepID=A0ABN7T8E2_OIKDI|nr:Oidioi.mRNA.OKI2018_I69.chr2.g7969.t1.cds [Oikopleura dioica]